MMTIERLVRLATQLGAEDAGGFSDAESVLVAGLDSTEMPAAKVRQIRDQIRGGSDPLGDMYCSLMSPEARRPLGQTFTPPAIVRSMIRWASDSGTPVRVVDPGSGSGRFVLAAGKKFPFAALHAVEIDPLAALLLRANLVANRMEKRSTVTVADFRSLHLEEVDGPTLFVGNPPYVRHHQIAPEWKAWLTATARRRGLEVSALAGLHVHFFLAVAEHGRKGDYGAFITASEWLDVNYGKLVRQLLLDGLGGRSIHVVSPEAMPFSDAATTATITCFALGECPSKVKLRRVDDVRDLGRLTKGRAISRSRLMESSRWSTLSRVSPKLPAGYIELGELCRVHRGSVTGANDVWVQRDKNPKLPERVLFPTVTRARELFGAGERLGTSEALHKVLDLPVDLDDLDSFERRQVEKFLRAAKALNVHEGYVAANRKAWWSVGLRDAAPILATYMARRPPAFVRNDAGARHINIAHGLYPREPLSENVLDRLAAFLRTSVSTAQGRTYAGGLVKFEPKEMERIPVPNIDTLMLGVCA